MTDFERLKEYRAEILWWEICCLLHDVGKLSGKFLRYRGTWQETEGGYLTRDPHDHHWLRDHETLLEPGGELAGLRKFFWEEIPLAKRKVCGALGVRRAVDEHGEDAAWAKHQLLYALKCADGSDSRMDRNNPLFGCEQKRPEGVPGDSWPRYRGNVFGHEGVRTRVFPEMLDRARKELYASLDQELRPFCVGPDGGRQAAPEEIDTKQYGRIRDAIRKYFEPAMADTTRPNNDTSLWEHTYSVASLTKVLHALEVLRPAPGDTSVGPPVPEDKMVKFRLWGIGLDSWTYVSRSHRIGDILGRRAVLHAAFEGIRRLAEFTYPIGNCVYRDDDSLVFLVPPLSDAAGEDFLEWFGDRAGRIAADESRGELAPDFYLSPVTGTLTQIVVALGELRSLRRIPLGIPEGKAGEKAGAKRRRARPDRMAEQFATTAADWRKNSSVCAVCRMRPAKGNASRLVCLECLDRRSGHTQGFELAGGPGQTPLISEIAADGRAALLVARFELRPWLSGEMIRTAFVTQAHAIDDTLAALARVKDLEADCARLKTKQWIELRGETNFGLMCDEFKAIRHKDPKAGDWLFLYARDFDLREGFHLNRDLDRANGLWERELEEFAEEVGPGFTKDDLLHIVCAKSPTPSSVLDVWETTKEFFEAVGGERAAYGEAPDGPAMRRDPALLTQLETADLNAKARRWLQLYREVDKLGNNQACLIRHRGKEREAVYEKGAARLWLAGEARQDEVWEKDWQIEIIDQDSKEIIEQAGIADTGVKERAYYPFRVISATPNLLLAIMPAKHAVAVALTLNKRYGEEFGKVCGRLPFALGLLFFPQHLPMFSVLDAARRMTENFALLHSQPPLEGRLRRKLYTELGSGEPDRHHPYVATTTPRETAKSYFRTSSAAFRHLVLAEEAGDPEDAIWWPNWFDYEFLGASADRFRVALDEDWADKAKKAASGLEAMRTARGGKFSGPMLLEDLESNMAALWELLKEEKATDSGTRNFEFLVRTRVEDWPEEKKETAMQLARSLAPRFFREGARQRILEAAQSGFLWRTLDLYLRILKDRVEKRGN
jgi:hypothetical protein